MIRSLNDIYEKDELIYHCNACGDINVVGGDLLQCGTEDDLSPRERNLYENYWTECAGCMMYVVTYKDRPGMVLGFLMDCGWMSDFCDKSWDAVTEEDMHRLYLAVSDYAKSLEREPELCGCEIWVGEDTDPAGHELLVFIPYERRDVIDRIAASLDDKIYTGVEVLV